MASKVKRQNISAEDVSPLARRYNRNVDHHARMPRRYFLLMCQPQGCTKQLFRVEAAWPFASAWRLRAFRAAPQILVRAPCRPVKAARSRCRQRPQFGVSSARGQPRGLIPLGPFLFNTGAVSGANPSNEVGCIDAARRPGSWWAHFFSAWRCVRPWLPQFGRAAPRHVRLPA